MSHSNLSNVKLTVPVVDLAHVPGTISNLADLGSSLRVDHLQVEILVVNQSITGSAVDLKPILDGQTKIIGLLTELKASFDILRKEEETIMADLSKLETDVTANTDVVNSAVTLLSGLKTALDAAGTDPVKLAALSGSLESNTAALAAAVAANTPGAVA